jgi:hypothetical protein
MAHEVGVIIVETLDWEDEHRSMFNQDLLFTGGESFS